MSNASPCSWPRSRRRRDCRACQQRPATHVCINVPERRAQEGSKSKESGGCGTSFWWPDVCVAAGADGQDRASEETSEEAENGELRKGLREACAEGEEHGKRHGDAIDNKATGRLANGGSQHGTETQAEDPEAKREECESGANMKLSHDVRHGRAVDGGAKGSGRQSAGRKGRARGEGGGAHGEAQESGREGDVDATPGRPVVWVVRIVWAIPIQRRRRRGFHGGCLWVLAFGQRGIVDGGRALLELDMGEVRIVVLVV